MNEFIKMMINDINNGVKNYNRDEIYYALKYYGVNKDIRLASDIDKFYQEFLGSLNNSLVKYEVRTTGKDENKTHYIAFYADEKANYLDAVKVYFPVKYEYMISALKTVFLYLIRNTIKATVKFYVKATNEGIVIRFYDKNDVKPFLDYCNNNFILNDFLLKGNPFMAKICGMGIVKDDNIIGTFNSTLSLLLEEYLTLLKTNNTLNNASELDFLNYVIKRGNIEENAETKFNMKEIEKSISTILNNNKPNA